MLSSSILVCIILIFLSLHLILYGGSSCSFHYLGLLHESCGLSIPVSAREAWILKPCDPSEGVVAECNRQWKPNTLASRTTRTMKTCTCSLPADTMALNHIKVGDLVTSNSLHDGWLGRRARMLYSQLRFGILT